MRYPILKTEMALDTLEKLQRGQEPEDDYCEYRGEGEQITQRISPDLLSELNALKQKYPTKLRVRDPEGGRFEAEACEVIHRILPCDIKMLADYDFWTWLAVCPLREVVEWRHGGDNKPAKPANFGIGSKSDNLFYRMWLRADIGYDPNRANHYELTRLGDQDFWRSHIIRQSYGTRRSFIRVLIQYQFQEKDGKPRLNNTEIRELAKRLRRLQFNLLLECLDEKESLKIIEDEAQIVKMSIAKATE